MKIDKVSYQKTYSIGPYLTERLGFEATLEEGDAPHNALIELRHIADRTHEKLNPHLYQESDGIKFEYPAARQNPPVASGGHAFIDYKAKEQLEIAIDNATTISELQAIKEECGKAGLLVEYVNKFNQLNNV